MVVDDIYAEAQDALGKCDATAVYRAITDAVKCINNKSLMDPNIGEMDLCVCEGFVTLPEDVYTVLEVNTGGWPTLLRNQWFQYHPSGTGTQGCTPCQYADEMGRYCTYRDPSGPVKLVAEIESAADAGKALRVYATLQGKKIYSQGTSGLLEEGFLVPTVFGFTQSHPDIGFLDTIYRIKKDLTNGFVKLTAINADGTTHTQVGYMGPNETEPQYRRLRVPSQSWVRIKYKKKDLIVRSRQDWINIDNHEALLLMIRAVKFRRDGRFDLAQASEGESIRLINDEAEALTPGGIRPVKIIYNDYSNFGSRDTLFY